MDWLATVEPRMRNTKYFHLCRRYVQVEAGDLSLMLRKSMEARDWLATVE
jgi:hypothetical protein